MRSIPRAVLKARIAEALDAVTAAGAELPEDVIVKMQRWAETTKFVAVGAFTFCDPTTHECAICPLSGGGFIPGEREVEWSRFSAGIDKFWGSFDKSFRRRDMHELIYRIED